MADEAIILQAVIETWGCNRRLASIRVVEAPHHLRFHLIGDEITDPDVLRELLALGHTPTFAEPELIPVSAFDMSYRTREGWNLTNPSMEVTRG